MARICPTARKEAPGGAGSASPQGWAGRGMAPWSGRGAIPRPPPLPRGRPMGVDLPPVVVEPLPAPPPLPLSEEPAGAAPGDEVDTGWDLGAEDPTAGAEAQEIANVEGTRHAVELAGAIEAGFCVRTLETGQIPPTANLDKQDPEIDIDVAGDTRAPDLTGWIRRSTGRWQLSATGLRYRFLSFAPPVEDDGRRR